MIANAVLKAGASLERLAASARAAWPERARAIDADGERLAQSPNTVVRRSWAPTGLHQTERSLRRVVAEVRMLRIAVDVRRGLPVPELADPLGDGRLVVTRGEDGWSVRSAFGEGGEPLERDIPRPSPR